MTTRELMAARDMAKLKALVAFLAIAAVVAIGFGIASIANGNDDSTVACSSGQWVHATVTKANGEKLSAENRRQLPPGYSATTASGDQKITINDDGSVTAEGGAVTVECVTPTK